MTPTQRYRSDLDARSMLPDPAQHEAVLRTQRIYDDLARDSAKLRSLVRQVWERVGGRRTVRGLYLWGGVGRGKTYLMDTLFECLPFEDKRRTHFHRFMQAVHRDLKGLRDLQRPLDRVAERMAKEARILCLDEFHVGDIADAMLLGNLLTALFGRGVTLVATSNEAPERLYWNGLQRERFLPAMDLILRHTEVVELSGGVDYRLRALERAEIYHCPLDGAAEQCLQSAFERLARGPGWARLDLEIAGRTIPTVRQADGVVWFDFEGICGGPRGASDYIEIALCHHTVLIGDIPSLDDRDNDRAKRLILLVDTLYDRRVKLIVSAQAPPSNLYTGQLLAAQFARTASRLEEMQSHAYLSQQHLLD
ncbi:MAG: cell division protein ZapE [Gammaproteobacteria bacterium]